MNHNNNKYSTEGMPTKAVKPAREIKSLKGLPEVESIQEGEAVPLGEEFTEETLHREEKAVSGPGPVEIEDEGLDEQVKPDTPLLGTNFEGIRTTSFPADPHIAVGRNHVLQAVNSSFRISNKSGTTITTNTFANFWNNHPGDRNPFDPWIAYDHFANRWVMLTVTYANDRKDSWFCLAASQSDDPTGLWERYYWRADEDGQIETDNWADYPKFGFDDTRIYITSNQFAASGGFQYAKLRVFDKAPFYAGVEISGWDWVRIERADGNNAFTIQPCVTFGTPTKQHLAATSSGADNKVTVWSVSKEATPKLTREATVTIGKWSRPDNAAQKDSSTRIHVGDARLLGAVFRNNTIYTCHTIKSDNYPTACGFLSINTNDYSREIDVAYGRANAHYYYPALNLDTDGTILMVFNVSSSKHFAQIRYASRAASDTRFQNSRLLKSGEASYVNPERSGRKRNRWGDYNGIALDPTDSRTFWFNAMYADSPANTWGTWVGQAS